MSEGEQRPTRRSFLWLSAIVATGAGLTAHLVAAMRSLVPRILYEPPKQRRIGEPKDFPEGPTYLAEHKLFVIRAGSGFRALSAVCTHLGCTVGQQDEGYHCPCHGSTFAADGKNTGGPAPRPLPWHPLTLSGGGALVVDLDTEVEPGQTLELSEAETR